MEQLTLATPVQPPTLTSYRVDTLSLHWSDASIAIGLRGPNGETATFTYTGPQATVLMQVLNTSDLSTKSLHRRILEKLAADGYLTGSITGSPD